MLGELGRQRESSFIQQPEFGNYNWVYWGESVCYITVEQSNMGTVCVDNWKPYNQERYM